MPGSTLAVLLYTLSFSLFFKVGFHVAEASLEFDSPAFTYQVLEHGVYHHA